MREKGKTTSLSGIAALLIFTVFAMGMVSVLLGGAGVYQRLTRRDQRAYARRTAAQYLLTKVRQGENLPEIGEFHGVDSLVFSQTIQNTEYVTRIYCYDGWLRELFTTAEGDFSLEDGEKILPMETMELWWADGIITVSLWKENEEPVRLSLVSRLGKGETP